MKIKYVSSLLFAASVFTVVVHAQQVVSYYAEAPSVAIGSPQFLELPGFDTRLGNLTQVKLTYSGEIWQSVFGENMNNASANYDLSTTAELSLAKIDGLPLFAPPPFTLKQKGTAGSYDGTVNFTGASGVRFDQNISTSGIYIDPQLAQYAGVNTIDFKVSTLNSSLLNADGNFAKGSSLSAMAGLSVDYTFIPLAAIPEPATFSFLIGGLALLAVALKRRLIAIA